MLVSIEHKIAFLAMTKAASTSIEMALSPYCDIAYYGNSRVKHMSCRKYKRFVAPYLNGLGYGDVETTCLIREPIDWLFSWYRYRSRPAINGRPQSTAGMTFEEFVTIYIANPDQQKGIGRPSRFVTNKDGVMSIDHLFKYENMSEYTHFLEDRFQQKLYLDRLNVSPEGKYSLSADHTSKLQEFFTPEYEIYESAIG